MKTVVTLVTFGVLGLSPPHSGTDPQPAGNEPVTTVTAPGAKLDSADPVRVHFLDVGQADCIYIQLPGDDDILIDGGDEGDGGVVVDYLRRQEVDDLELLIATHPHRDHIGGLPEIMAAFPVERAVDSSLDNESFYYRAWAEAVTTEGCPWVEDGNQVFRFGAVELQLLTGNEWRENPNDYSVVARLDCGDVEFMFTGDAGEEVEEMLTGEISAEVLKVGHHGSRSSTSARFLARVKPEWAVISAGAGNRYGHPHAETLSRLQRFGLQIHRTDYEGTMVIETDGYKYWIGDAE